jgi:hypothetical protein
VKGIRFGLDLRPKPRPKHLIGLVLQHLLLVCVVAAGRHVQASRQFVCLSTGTSGLAADERFLELAAMVVLLCRALRLSLGLGFRVWGLGFGV